MGPTRNQQPVYVNEQDLLFSDLFFYSKKKKVGAELETKATKNMAPGGGAVIFWGFCGTDGYLGGK